jgi:hypothetical protein
MKVITAPSTDTSVESSSGISMSCYVELSETEQIIIEIDEWDYNWNSATNGWQKTGTKKKVRLERLDYQLNYEDKESFVLNNLKVRGYRKDGGLRFRDEWFHQIDKEVLAQIPDSYHDYARKSFAEQVVKLQQELTAITNNGVSLIRPAK